MPAVKILEVKIVMEEITADQMVEGDRVIFENTLDVLRLDGAYRGPFEVKYRLFNRRGRPVDIDHIEKDGRGNTPDGHYWKKSLIDDCGEAHPIPVNVDCVFYRPKANGAVEYGDAPVDSDHAAAMEICRRIAAWGRQDMNGVDYDKFYMMIQNARRVAHTGEVTTGPPIDLHDIRNWIDEHFPTTTTEKKSI